MVLRMGLFIWFALFLMGCSTTPPTQFYSLDAVAVPKAIALNVNSKKPLIGVAQISLPSALERKQIVTHDAQGQLHLAEQHQWAALLKQNITEVIAQNLTVQQPDLWFKAHPWSVLGIADYRLVIDVTRLDIFLGERIAFSVNWTLLNEKKHTVLQHDSIDLVHSLADDRYETVISALNVLLVQLSEKLATIHFSE